MTDSKTTGDKTISVGPKPRLTLKRGAGVERDTVRQSFSHGRTNTVQVERKKRRVVMPGEKPEVPPPVSAPVSVRSSDGPAVSRATQERQDRNAAAKAGIVLRQLSSDEIDARARALADARVHEAEERRHAEEGATRRAQEAERLARERADAERRKVEEDARHQAEELARTRAEETARRRFGGEVKPEAGEAAKLGAVRTAKEIEEDEEKPGALRGRRQGQGAGGAEGRSQGRGGPPPRQADADQRARRFRAGAVARLDAPPHRARQGPHGGRRAAEIVREVILPETITIQELANRMSERAVEVVKFLMKQGNNGEARRRDRRRYGAAGSPRRWATPSAASPKATSRRACSRRRPTPRTSSRVLRW